MDESFQRISNYSAIERTRVHVLRYVCVCVCVCACVHMCVAA